MTLEAESDQSGNTKVRLTIATTAGFYPPTGYEEVPQNQKVQVELKKAAKALSLEATDGWVVTVDAAGVRRVIDPDQSYAANGLQGDVRLDWGPPAGGGG